MTTTAPGAAAAGAVPLVAVTRSGFTESVHTGIAVTIDRDGIVTAYGDADAAVYPRSALKPFQTVAAERAGARLDARDLAIVSASHTGRPEHVGAVRRVLAGAGLDDSALQTPAAWPSDDQAARDLAVGGGQAAPITMNCSGNHAGMLAGCVARGWSPDAYLAPDHPIHAAAATVLAECCGVRPEHQGVDGCGGPVWALPLTALARGLRALALQEPHLVAAVRAHPELVEGPGTATSAMITALDVLAKPGAEGVFTAVAPDGTAVAVKALDGGRRPGAFVGAALLARAGGADADAAAAFLGSDRFRVRGGAAAVGELRLLV